MAATLAAIDAALFAALAALSASPPTDAQPFALVGRYDGEPTKDGLLEAMAQFPCALLRWDDEKAVRDVDTAGPGSEDRGAGHWTVLVALEDPRAIDDALQGATGAPGLFALVDAVLGACNALQVAGLWRGRSVRYVDATPVRALTVRGVAYARAVRFEALRAAPTAADPVVSTQPLTDVRGDINQQNPGGDAPRNPFETFDSTTT